MIDTLWQDIRYAARGLRRSPGFALAAIVTLALGIGANTAIFSFVEAVLLRPVPVRAPEELFFAAHGVSQPIAQTSSNYPHFERLRARTDVFADATAFSTESFNVSAGGPVEVVSGAFVSGNYHGMLGVRMGLGRGFVAENDRTGVALVAVISDAYWTRAFGRDPNVVGQTLVIQDRPVTIVGVTTPGFAGLEAGRRADITLPMSAIVVLDDPAFLNAHDNLTSLPIVVRLAPGVTQERAAAVVHAELQQYLAEPDNQWWRRGRNGETRTGGLLAAGYGSDYLREDYSAALTVLMAIVAIVLMIGCVNVANLLLARSPARAKEVAVRMSLGAGRQRLVRQFLVESLLLAAIGGGIGFVLARAGTSVIVRFFAIGENPVVVDASLDASVLLFATGISLLTALAFGMVPALSATQVELTPALKDGAASAARRRSPRQLLVAGQIALCLMLVTAAGLLVRTLQNLEAQDIGVDRRNVLMFSANAEGTSFPREQMPQFCGAVFERLRERPGVVATSCSTSVPVRGSGSTRGITVTGLPPSLDRDAFSNEVTPEYFHTFGVRLVRGRLLTAADTATSQKVAVISERLAREYFSGDPIGQTIRFGITQPREAMLIVGIVGDTYQFDNLREPPPRTIYTPLSQAYEMPEQVTVALRSLGDPAPLAPAARADAQAVNGNVVIDYVRTMEEQIESMVVRERVLATLSMWFGGLALLLAGVGLYGVMLYEVNRRRRDIGIRLALGAHPRLIRRQVLTQAAIVAGVGVAAGIAATLGTTRFLAALLFGLTPQDPWTLAAAAVLLALIALGAAYFPARRASRVDPVAALRSE